MSLRVLFILMVVSCAAMLTAHVAIVIGLATKPPRTRALLALVLPPLGAYWAIREKQRIRGITWIVAALLYVIARLLG